MMIPESENPIEARPSFVARAKLDAALYLATTTHKQTHRLQDHRNLLSSQRPKLLLHHNSTGNSING